VTRPFLSSLLLLLSLPLAAAPARNQAAPSSAVPPGTAPAASAAPPTVDAVLAHYVRALGGQAALQKLTSRLMKGAFEIPAANVSGSAELDMQAPDRFFSSVSIPDGGDHILVFDGKTGWSREPGSGLREITGLELDQLRRSSQFLYESRLRSLFRDVRVVKQTTEQHRPVWLLEATPAAGPPEQFYFDVETGLLLRHDSLQATSEGEVPVQHRYANYVSVDGVQVPSLLLHHDPHIDWQVKFTEIRHNLAMDPAKFARPAASETPAH